MARSCFVLHAIGVQVMSRGRGEPVCSPLRSADESGPVRVTFLSLNVYRNRVLSSLANTKGLLLAVSVLAFLWAAMACSSGEPIDEDKVLVEVSINPLASLAQSVGGNRVDVERLIPPGASPHTYEPTPSQVKRMGRADVLILIGMGLEFWADDLVSAANNPDLVVVETSENVDPIEGNHHIWLDPLNAVSQALLIRDALIEADPDGEQTYTDNATALVSSLRALDEEIAAEISGWSQRSFIAFHPAWVYFARRYGLEQAAVVERTPGREPSPGELVDIVAKAREIGARAIFAEPQFSPSVARTIAEESGAKVLFLDPIGGAKAPDDYLGMIRYNVETMAQAMR